MKFLVNFLGGEEGRKSGWSGAMDPSRRRAPLPAVTAGSLSKQKSPVANEQPASKDAVVRLSFKFQYLFVAFCGCNLRLDHGSVLLEPYT